MFLQNYPGKKTLIKVMALACMLAVSFADLPLLSIGQAEAGGYTSAAQESGRRRGGGNAAGIIGIAVGVAILSVAAQQAQARQRSRTRARARSRTRIKPRKRTRRAAPPRKTVQPRRHARSCPANSYASRARSGRCSCKKGFKWSGRGRSKRCVANRTRVATSCPANAYKSKKRRGKCTCRSGFKWAGRGRKAHCRKNVAPPRIVIAKISCKWPEVKTRSGRSCTCARGYNRSGSTKSCRKNRKPTIVPVYKPTPVRKAPRIDVARIQRCLQKAGFNPGPVDGKSGRKTINAYRAFQSKTGLRSTSNLRDRNTRTVLFDQCDARPPKVIVAKAPVLTAPKARVMGFKTVVSTQTSAVYSPIPTVQRSCLSPDIYKLVRATYGPRTSQSACSNECVTKPRSLTENQLETISARTGIKWCTDCVQLNSYLPLRDILKIERAANISLCATPNEESLCKVPGSQSKSTMRTVVKTKIRTILKRLPPQADHKGDVAVLIGNENYGNSLPENTYGLSDAEAVRTLLVENLGYEERNIIHLKNATLADMEGVFGAGDGQGGRLSRLLKKNGNGNVFIYASSHGLALSSGEDLLTTGAAGRATAPRKSYLLPVDAKAQNTIDSAYSLERFYQSLGDLRANSIVVALEAGFSNDLSSRIQAPNIPEFDVDAMPTSQIPGLVVIKASEKDQKTLNDPEFGIGIFTRYLIEGYGGRADDERFGRQDGHVDSIELFAYISQLVRDTARKSFGMTQKPTLHQVENLVVGRLMK
ncbi:MAG: caspase family protein [Hyphomicrobiaceae bacterium]|nr:caspase family protein [Hyphomicrobiaceae bacterium]